MREKGQEERGKKERKCFSCRFWGCGADDRKCAAVCFLTMTSNAPVLCCLFCVVTICKMTQQCGHISLIQ